MINESAIIAAAAKRVLDADIAKYVPKWAAAQIPADTTEKTANEIATAAAADLAAARGGQS